MKKSVLLLSVTLSIALTSCSAGKKALQSNDFEYQNKMAKMLTSDINNRFIEVGATGSAMTYNTAKNIAVLNAKAEASRIIAEILTEVRAQDTDNELSDSKNSGRSLSTVEVYDATVTAKAKSLMRFAETIEVFPGKAQDGSGEKMMIVRVRVPLKNDQSVTLLEEATDETNK